MQERVTAAEAVERYFSAWVDGDAEGILATLDPDCVIIESHGPTYRGLDPVRRWVEAWHGDGSTVDRWDVDSTVVEGELCVVEWVFECTIDGVSYAFDGASVVTVRDGLIIRLREYRTTEPLFDADA